VAGKCKAFTDFTFIYCTEKEIKNHINQSITYWMSKELTFGPLEFLEISQGIYDCRFTMQQFSLDRVYTFLRKVHPVF
jgi:hypothetical protein